ncbi:prolipoprotein diacylglyceryl transferase [Brevibacterium daeguense]|uniref:prolipoprotein diacylglyceryl transferase n=1 Tax=Brevibacterium daeguense TaxID=909936 RepID=UPI001F015BF8
MADILAAIPSPGWRGFDLGPVTIHAYALCILLGIVLALWVTNRRWAARGGSEDDLWNIAIWAIPAGIIGGRLYHIFSTPDPYFGPGGNPVAALYIWNGGLGIWGAVALGVLTVFLVCRYYGIRFTAFLDAAAPGLILAQAVGRWGNWFNQELFGSPTTLPWGLQIDKTIGGAPNPNWPDPALPADTLFHPTFLYESIWNFIGFALLIWAGRAFRLGYGQVFFLYICYYTAGRVWIEALRIDTAELIFGVRLNVWVSILIFLLGAVLFIVSRSRHKTPEPEIYTERHRRFESEASGSGEGSGPGSAEDSGSGDSGAGHPGAGKLGGEASSAATGSSADRSAAPRKRGAEPDSDALNGDGQDSGDDQGPSSSMTKRSFGFFGAVTSAISIVPQVGPRARAERRRARD